MRLFNDQQQGGEGARTPQSDTVLTLRGISVAYHEMPVLWDIDYSVPRPDAKSGRGYLCAIIGPNGAGKSTLIKAALGMVPCLSGDVQFFGQSLAQARKRVAYVPQRSLVDWDFPATALDVVAMGLYGRIGWLRPVTRRWMDEARHYLDQMGLADYAHRQIGQLSGGQQQRVFLARALAQKADLYLMDEPFAGVDAATERAIIHLLKTLSTEGKTVIAVHHDLETVPDYFDHVLLLNRTVTACGATRDIFTPHNLQHCYGGSMAMLASAHG